MNPYIEKLKEYMHDRPVDCQIQDVSSVLALLCYIYAEQNPIENDTIRYQFQKLNGLIQRFTLQEQDAVSNLVCALCTEYLRQAFLAGVQVGFHLETELSGS